MTKIKLCGLMRVCDIEAANAVQPDYIGFVFAPKSKRFVSREQAAVLKERLDSSIQAVGVFVNEFGISLQAVRQAVVPSHRAGDHVVDVGRREMTQSVGRILRLGSLFRGALKQGCGLHQACEQQAERKAQYLRYE